MISDEQIRILALKHQTTELNIRREYFQHLFLSYFYRQPQSAWIYFKGGTALRIIYRSPRFSEDLDFSATFWGSQEIEQAIQGTLLEIEREGIQVQLVESKPTTGGYLASLSFLAGAASVVVQLQISLREGEKTGEVATVVSDFIPAYTAMGLSLDQLVEEKIQALLSRKKPRDFYDLYFILRSNLLPTSKRGVVGEAAKALEEVDLNFEKELKQFLPKTHWAITRDFKQTLQHEVERFT